jgi:hypothetical protein
MMEEIITGDWMQTASGRKFYPGVAEQDFNVHDLAKGLSNYCRYGGQCAEFYSVAEHSLLVSQQVERSLHKAIWNNGDEHIAAVAYQALWHDATEALMGDMTRPWKKRLPEFMKLEAELWAQLAKFLDTPVMLHPLVKHHDNTVLMAEAHVLHVEPPEPWGIRFTPADVVIRCLPPVQARAEFLSRHFSLRQRMGHPSLF